MCNIEETTVRDEAVASLNLIGKQMEPEQIKVRVRVRVRVRVS